jgi:hypothetical protein
MAGTVTLLRLNEFAHSTPGVLHINGAPSFMTLEPPWLDNARGFSCVPDGRYRCVRVESPSFGDTWEVIGIPDRSAILFHAGNTASDTEGCIVVGDTFGWIAPYFAVLNSRKAFKRFMELTAQLEGFELNIIKANYE